MSGKRFIHGIYDDDDVLLSAIKNIRAEKYDIEEVYTPFPVHGLDKALGIEETRIAIMAFIYGCIGLIVAFLMMDFIMIKDWPQNIGGKPSFSFLENMPSFVPVMFEMTVFFAAHLMVLTYLIRCKLYPGSNQKSPDPRTTDDMFLMEIVSNGNDKDVIALIKKTGAVEVKEEKID